MFFPHEDLTKMHQIRLRRPWQKRLSGQTESFRIDVPEAESDSQSPAGTSATYQRSFNQPSGLDDSARVYLRIESWQGDLASLTVNEQPLEVTSRPLTCEITERLKLT